MKKTTPAEIRRFQKTVWDFYNKEGRHDLPWRKTKDAYKILVSEVMLQQTQVDRVVPKYKAFLKTFPSVEALARAPLQEVLLGWSGLGYNRRALYLQRTAKAVVADHKGKFPKDAEMLETLPGVGPYTARAVATFSHDTPCVFIETNIRRVFIYTFFPERDAVSDTELFPLIERALPFEGFREWYWALMDYGSQLKKTVKNPNKRSAHYTKQSRFEGSVRELRGEFLRKCTQGPASQASLLRPYIKADRVRAERALSGLLKDGMLDLDKKGRVTVKQ